MSLNLLLIFAMTELVLSLTPGPAVLLIVSQGIRNGFKSSIRGALGILTGNAIYFALSALGLGALLLASTTLFEAIRWVGAGYLILTGVRMLFLKTESEPVRVIPFDAPLKLFSQGLLTQLSNPKAIVFFTALLPQFISPGANVWRQFLILGIVSITVEFPVLLIYGWVAEQGKGRILRGRTPALPGRVAGGFLVGAGAGLAWMRNH
ncbi:MAG: LysE family translocator [Armatimonadota bacterium]